MNNRRTTFFFAFAALLTVARAQTPESRLISIQEMFALADRNSKQLRPATSNVGEAQEAIAVAKNTRLPEVETSLALAYLGDGYLLDRDFANGMTAPIPHFGNNFALKVSQVIYSGGAIPSGIAVAELQAANAQLGLDNSRNNLRFSLVGYYLDLFKQRNLRRVYEMNIEQTKQLLKDLQAKGNEGIMLKNDITRYELLLANLTLTLTHIQNTITILNNNLTTTLGLPYDVTIEPDTALLSAALPTETTDYWAATAAEHSPTLKQLALNMQITNQQDKIIRSERLPKLALVAGNNFDGPIIIEVPPINKNLNYWYVGIGVSYKLSSLYTTKNSINRNKFTMQRTAEQYDAAKEQTELAIKADYIKYLEAYDALRTQQMSVELAHQNYSVVSNRYKNDMALITDMLDASNAKLAAEVQLANAQINIVFSYFSLLYVSGTLSNY
jgi:outer membrane protein TolC